MSGNSKSTRIITKKISLLLSGLLLFSLIPSVFAMPENIIYGSTIFEKLPIIEAGKTTEFSLKLFYKSGTYPMDDLKPIIDIYPVSFSQYLNLKSEYTNENLYPISTLTVKGNITAGHDIPSGKVTLVYYFSGKDVVGNSYRSSGIEASFPIDIKNKDSKNVLQELQQIDIINYDKPPLKQFRAGVTSEEIKCKEGLDLVIKLSNGTPACVKPESKQKLVEWGWAVNY